ncbi:hypothetical protein B0H17DRAFT_1151006 [Mycena rosella]|uniref:Uncharacterized protein n=1 Tax=Mycena rosella TaxID=1033263 RepID=A0AAD7BNX6_MYCRO|nr:hypothetical protein B0H17DRAFT_1151006 [Mycena rosella]
MSGLGNCHQIDWEGCGHEASQFGHYRYCPNWEIFTKSVGVDADASMIWLQTNAFCVCNIYIGLPNLGTAANVQIGKLSPNQLGRVEHPSLDTAANVRIGKFHQISWGECRDKGLPDSDTTANVWIGKFSPNWLRRMWLCGAVIDTAVSRAGYLATERAQSYGGCPKCYDVDHIPIRNSEFVQTILNTRAMSVKREAEGWAYDMLVEENPDGATEVIWAVSDSVGGAGAGGDGDEGGGTGLHGKEGRGRERKGREQGRWRARASEQACARNEHKGGRKNEKTHTDGTWPCPTHQIHLQNFESCSFADNIELSVHDRVPFGKLATIGGDLLDFQVQCSDLELSMLRIHLFPWDCEEIAQFALRENITAVDTRWTRIATGVKLDDLLINDSIHLLMQLHYPEHNNDPPSNLPYPFVSLPTVLIEEDGTVWINIKHLHQRYYWSFDPLGGQWLEDVAAQLSFPQVLFKIIVGGYCWTTNQYDSLRKFHEAKGVNYSV